MIIRNKTTGNTLEVNEFGAQLFMKLKELIGYYGEYRASRPALAETLNTNTASMDYWIYGFWKVGLINTERKPGHKYLTYTMSALSGFDIDD